MVVVHNALDNSTVVIVVRKVIESFFFIENYMYIPLGELIILDMYGL